MNPAHLWLPALLGVVAAGGNYALLKKARATHEVVAVRAELPPGTRLAEDHLYPVSVAGQRELFGGVVAYADRQALYGQPVRRRVTPGELLLRADVELADYQIDHTLIPPGHTALRLPARLAQVAGVPLGEPVSLVVLTDGRSAAGTQKQFGLYRYLGYVAAPGATGTDADQVLFEVAVPDVNDGRLAPLHELAAGRSAGRLTQVAVTR